MDVGDVDGSYRVADSGRLVKCTFWNCSDEASRSVGRGIEQNQSWEVENKAE